MSIFRKNTAEYEQHLRGERFFVTVPTIATYDRTFMDIRGGMLTTVDGKTYDTTDPAKLTRVFINVETIMEHHDNGYPIKCAKDEVPRLFASIAYVFNDLKRRAISNMLDNDETRFYYNMRGFIDELVKVNPNILMGTTDNRNEIDYGIMTYTLPDKRKRGW